MRGEFFFYMLLLPSATLEATLFEGNHNNPQPKEFCMNLT